ncbi:hypothetical protein S40288_05123 [Stachybotrys chartarum IBT 40288]|nr:hypothetical protein S40288_05123 [Stachybotrys chartarum IBT 40288]
MSPPPTFTGLATQNTHYASDADDPDVAPGSQNRLVVYRVTTRSLPMALLHTMLKPFRPKVVTVKKHLPGDSQRLTPNRSAKRTCDVRERDVAGIWVYDVTAKGAVSKEGATEFRPQKRIIYFAGGAWQMPPSPNHWAMVAALATRLPDTVITLVSAPLAPKAPASVSLPQLRRMYSALMRESRDNGERVVVMGDSSGGNISLSLVAWAATSSSYQAQAGTAPAAVMLISPSTDLRHAESSIHEAAKSDPLLTLSYIQSTARTWCPSDSRNPSSSQTVNPTMWTVEDPAISPILAPLEPLAKKDIRVHGVTGSYDVLAPEAVAFREKLQAAGVRGEWLEWDKQMHCFPLAFRFKLKESIRALDWIVDVLVRT